MKTQQTLTRNQMNRAPSLKALEKAGINVVVKYIWEATNYNVVLNALIKYCPKIKDIHYEHYNANNPHNFKFREFKRELINRVLENFGIEYLGQHKRNKEHVYYSNTGDTYNTTLLFMGDRMLIGCWGDLAEKNLIKEGTAH